MLLHPAKGAVRLHPPPLPIQLRQVGKTKFSIRLSQRRVKRGPGCRGLSILRGCSSAVVGQRIEKKSAGA